MSSQSTTVAVLGAGNFGTAFAKVLAENGHTVHLWNWSGDPDVLLCIEKHHENKKYLPGIKLPKNIIPVGDMQKAVQNVEVVFFAIPSHVVSKVADSASPFLKKETIIADISKGLIPGSLELVPACVADRVGSINSKNVVSIAGPAIAKQLAKKKFTAMNIAGKNKKVIARVREIVENEYVKLIPCEDIEGVEIGGVGKNVYAIAIGMCDGIGIDLNAKAALITIAMEEMSRLVKAMGGKKETAYSLAGLGDLIGTAFSPDSRNRRFGEYLAKGLSKEKALEKVGQTVEGINAASCFVALCEKHRIDAPMARMVLDALEGKHRVKEIVRSFLQKM